jgi:hypothetical protein
MEDCFVHPQQSKLIPSSLFVEKGGLIEREVVVVPIHELSHEMLREKEWQLFKCM